MSDVDSRSAVARVLRNPHMWLTVYIIALALIAFWPTHVDQGMGPFLHWVVREVPFLSYNRIEFAANIVLFVPFGVCLMLILERRYLIVPIALVSTVTIEAVQSLMDGRRTPSVLDVISNLTGACLGMLIVAVVEWATRAIGESARSTRQSDESIHADHGLDRKAGRSNQEG